MAISVEEVLSQSTAYATSAYNATIQQRSAQLSSMANSANQLYIQAANQAAVQAGTVGREQALRQALTDLAGKGVSISTYMRKDGVTVTTPVDVGVRRMINDQLRQRGIQQVTELAKELDRNYVEVSITANCRESHADWQGQIYSLEPDDETYPYFYDACNYGDPVDGIGGYNCGHDVHIYRPEVGSTFTDPLEGTGYTTEEVRELTATQRALENNIRKTKRQVSTLKAAGYDTTALSAKLRNYKQQLSELLNTHSAVLRDAGSYRTGVNRAQIKLIASVYSKKSSITGAISGAYNDSNDPYGALRNAHAKRYYEEVRNRSARSEISIVAANSGIDKDIVEMAYQHLFVETHELTEGVKRFDEDYDIAQSWARLRNGGGKDIQPHDLTLILHEAAESHYMAQGLSYDEAHEKANALGYNYQKEVKELNKG